MQDWAAWGVSWLGSWGESWGPLHQVEDTHRPRTNPNLRLRRIKDVRHRLTGYLDVDATGQVRGKTIHPVIPQSVHARGRVRGSVVSDGCGAVSGRTGSRARLRGFGDTVSAGTARGKAGSVGSITGGKESDLSGQVITHCGSRGAVPPAVELDASSDFDDMVAIQNPTDEELLVIALNLLTRKQVCSIKSVCHPVPTL